MKLPSHVLTKLYLAGAVGTAGVVATCEPAPTTEPDPIASVIDEPLYETVHATPDPMPIVEFAKPPPKRITKPLVKPKPAPIAAHVCGPCGQG